MDFETASCTMELPSGIVPEWVHLIPAGEFTGRDGRAFNIRSPKKVLAAFAANAMDLPIDYEHQSENSQTNGKPAPAAGWIKELDARGDGIWGRVEWTAKARQMLSEREYRFLSPVLVFNRETKEVVRLASAGLTNSPNLFLRALSRQEPPIMKTDFATKIKELLGLPADTEETSVLEALQKGANSLLDPARYVPVAQVQKLMGELADLKATAVEELAENRVAQAMRSGKLPPALEGWGIALCRQNPEAFQEFIDKTPPTYADMDKPVVTGLLPNGRRSPLGETERAICRNLGISEEDLRANLAKS
ncbi:conserved hypothetical protein [uncultured Alphaproteobacteria bacterium]|uniref:Mu-like prophage I protein n=1 Tax=uncultured Alphaproteobacteria bacterium TaxID=91750 RepID=A0A212JNM9_9PROT|nr:conserved hypothetical protein [uncultured Alphaproteobacteria bacterium]